METMPNWFWIVYYSLLLITLGAAIFSVVRKKMINLSMPTIVFTVMIPIITLINSMGRTEGMNELEYFFSQLQEGVIWSILIAALYLYLIVWWVLMLFKKDKNTSSS